MSEEDYNSTLSDDEYPHYEVDSDGNPEPPLYEDVDMLMDDSWTDHDIKVVDQRQACCDMKATAEDIDDWYQLKCQSANWNRYTIDCHTKRMFTIIMRGIQADWHTILLANEKISVYSKTCSCIFYQMKVSTEHEFNDIGASFNRVRYEDKCWRCNSKESYAVLRMYWTSWDCYTSLCEDCYFKYCDLCLWPRCTNKGWINSWASSGCVCNNPPASICQVHRYREYCKGNNTEHLMWESLQRKLAKGASRRALFQVLINCLARQKLNQLINHKRICQ